MKKIYLGFSTLFCLTILLTLDSCTTDSVLVSDDPLGTVDGKNENPYFNSKKENGVSVNVKAPYVTGDRIPNTAFGAHQVPDSITTYSSTEGDKIIDPDWKKLVTHFTDSSGTIE